MRSRRPIRASIIGTGSLPAFSYALPFAKNLDGLAARHRGGLARERILIVQSGAPFTVNLSSAAGQDVAHIGLVNGNNLERPNLVANPNDGPKTPSEWFNTAAFALPAQNSSDRRAATWSWVRAWELWICRCRRKLLLHETTEAAVPLRCLQLRSTIRTSICRAASSEPRTSA